ncbi:MAG: S41 family peptidase [Bacteroidota bacterium]
MNKKTKIYLPLILSFAVAIGIFIGSTFNYKTKTVSFFGENAKEKKIKRLIDYIQYDYVDEVDTDSLLDGTIRDLLSKLDPHSVYIPPKEHDRITETMNGKFVGIGIQFRMFKDSLTVVKVLDNGPSEKAGLLEGDRILTANNDTLYGKNLNSNFIISKLKGEPNTPVDITVYRKSENKNIPFTILRGDVPIESVDAFYMLNDSIGYIKINKFSATTYNEFKLALDNLIDEGMQELVLDLRQNPGGFLQVATKIIDEFLEDDKLIVFTKDKRNKIDESFATAKGEFENGGIYVLIDGGSASASEIVAGALQDNDKGIIIGRRSFGKGLVQQEMDLGDGSAVRLTVSRYYTPTGRSIQKPYDHNGNKDYFNDSERRFYDGELVSADSIKVIDSLKYITPKGKVVYGGGGIIPDIFVPLDTTLFLNRFHYRKINDFVFGYYDSHRGDFKDITFDEFNQNFDNDDKIYNAYQKSIINDFHTKEANDQEENLKIYLKALFAQQLFDTNSYFKVINQDDKMLERVLEIEKKGLPILQ